MVIKVYCDGGARGNPGPAAIGVLIQTPQQQYSLKRYLGKKTNNQAEYEAVLAALTWLKTHLPQLKPTTQAKFFLDASLVVNQLNGNFKVKNSSLRELLLKIRNLEGQLPFPITYHYIPRQANKTTDQLVNQALNEQRLPNN